jgi:hypothetical protein
MSPLVIHQRLARWRSVKSGWTLPIACALALAFLTLWLVRSSDTGANRYALSPSAKALNLSGRPVDPFQSIDAQSMVFIFVSVDCPISNSYAPEVRRLAAEFGPRGVAFRLVYPNADETPEIIKKHLKDYDYTLEAFWDPQHELTRAAGAKVTPEAIVFVRGRGFVYRGRIDDRFVQFGKTRVAPTQHDLKDALTAILNGKAVPQPITRAVGCYISEVP